MAGRPDAKVAVGAAAATELPSDLVPDIARQLEDSGEYRVSFVPVDPQRLVDLRWAALGAGRMIGRRVHVVVSRAQVDPGNTPITVRVTCGPMSRPNIPRQRAQES